MKTFLSELLWPAAAGNVLWSGAVLLIDDGLRGRTTDVAPRLILLGILGGYLAFEWCRSRRTASGDAEKDAAYWTFETLHLLGIIALSIGCAAGKPADWLAWVLTAILAVTAIGHTGYVWGVRQANLKPWPDIVAIAGLLILPSLRAWNPMWNLPGAAAFALVCWLVILWRAK